MAISPQELIELRVYGGARGFWIDKARTTGVLTVDGLGATVSVLHTGRYNDDLSETEVVYSYPRTLTPAWDDNQISATRNAANLKLPIFVIAQSPIDPKKKRVRLGWITGMDDGARQVLIAFGEEPIEALAQPAEEDPFLVKERRPDRVAKSTTRPGQSRFRYQVLARYGPVCPLCGMGVAELLETPHVVPYANQGTNDPRNGMVMCATHHRAFDAGFFAIDPRTASLCYAPAAPRAGELMIETDRLFSSGPRPHFDALNWRWNRWRSALRLKDSQDGASR
jgi:hypothetical protein